MFKWPLIILKECVRAARDVRRVKENDSGYAERVLDFQTSESNKDFWQERGESKRKYMLNGLELSESCNNGYA